MAKFIAVYYAPWFLQARSACRAPQLDIDLWKDMYEFQNVDREIAREVRKSLMRHLWYLTEELVIFAFFDRNLDNVTKQQMARVLRGIPRPATFPPGKPKFPREKLIQSGPAVQLSDLIGPKSWLFFHLVQANGNWLRTHPNQWMNDQEYMRMYDIVKNLEVVNDAAEKGMKDVQEYAKIAKDGKYRDKIVLVSTSHRCKIPKFKKNEMENKM